MTAESAQYEPEESEPPVSIDVVVDSRGRVSLGKAGAEPGRRYRVEQRGDGVLLLIPVVSIPEREMIVWRNPQVAQAIREGLDQAERGETVDRGSFSQYVDQADDDDED
jgi:hypothetical protein